MKILIISCKVLLLFQLGDQLCVDVASSSATSRKDRQNFQIKSASQGYPPVSLLLQR